MKNIFLVARREFYSQVKNKTFIIMTILSPLLILGAVGITFLLGFANNSEMKNIALIDESAEFLSYFKSDKKTNYSFYTPQEKQSIKDTLKDSKYLNALLIIPENTDGNYQSIEQNIELITNGSLGIIEKEKIRNLITKKIENKRLGKLGVSSQVLESLKPSVHLNVFNIKEGNEDKGLEIRMVLSGILSYVIFMFILIYGVKIMRSVVEEKSNRVVEIIISSITPFQLMLGKILGTTLVAISQFLIWILLITSILSIFPLLASNQIGADPNLLDQSETLNIPFKKTLAFSELSEILLSFNYSFMLVCFFLYFILGYLFYSSIFAAIGSAVDSDSDTQQFTYFPMIPMSIGLYGGFTTLENPDGPVAFWLSMIPFTSPISMISRVSFNLPIYQLLLSLFILLISTIGMIYFASKIYRVGILVYGKKPTLKEIIKWIRYKS